MTEEAAKEIIYVIVAVGFGFVLGVIACIIANHCDGTKKAPGRRRRQLEKPKNVPPSDIVTTEFYQSN